MGTHWGRASYRGEDSRGRKGSRVSLLSWNETLVRRGESAGRVQSGRVRSCLEEDARVPRQQTTIIRGGKGSLLKPPWGSGFGCLKPRKLFELVGRGAPYVPRLGAGISSAIGLSKYAVRTL